MATLYITEFSDLAKDGNGNLIPVASGLAKSQKVTYTSAKTSQPFRKTTKFILLYSAADAYIEFGKSGSVPTATANSEYIPAGKERWRGVSPDIMSALSVYDGST